MPSLERHIEVEDLVVRYGDVVAVDRISLEVRRGEHMTLLGPSGCGKTTTLRALAGLETPTAGEIRIDGRPLFSSRRGINVPAEQRQLPMVFQSYAIWPHMTVFDNVAYGLRLRRLPRAQVEERTLAVLNLVRLTDLARRSAADLSGGQQQRVALARSLAISPAILLLDEPLSNLDARLRAGMRLEIQALQRQIGLTSVYVTHDQEEALVISDRIIVMNAGRIEQIGSAADIYDTPRNAFVADFVGAANLISGIVRPELERDGLVGIETDAKHVVYAIDPGRPVVSPATVAIRSVYLELASEPRPGAVNAWPVRVRQRAFLGEALEYVLDWDGRLLTARRPRGEVFQEGETVHAHVDPARCVLLE
jgi:ABC-type Fe3+/spermidine/putrescine transport system ATPase subunit